MEGPFVNRLINVSSTDPDDARRRQLLNILLVGVAAATVSGLLTATIANALNLVEDDVSLLTYGGLVALAGSAVIFAINRYWSGPIASVLFLLLVTGVVATSDDPHQVVNGRSLFTFAIPILMASVLLRSWASFLSAGVVNILLAVIAVDIGLVPPVPTMLGFFAIALVAWLAARSLEQALDDVRTVNRELDQRVAERTRDLAEALAREHATATRNRAVLEGIADGVIVFDNAGKAIMANPAITNLIERPLGELIGLDVNVLFGRDLREIDREVIKQLLANGNTRYPTFKIGWKEKTLSVSLAHVQNASGDPIGTVAVFRDFTREAELDQMKSDFISIASHELRTPLTSIRGYLDLLTMGTSGRLNDQQHRFVRIARDNAERLHQLVNDLLDVSRIESGRIELDVQVIAIRDVIIQAASMMEKQFVDRGLTLSIDLPPGLPQIFGDPTRLGQIMANLLSNAYKYTPEGGATVRARHTSYGVQVDVIDTGIGIAPDDQSRLFTRFFRADHELVRDQPGTGLGLSITRSLVEMHGGQMWVTSRLGQGSTFSFSLPLPAGHDGLQGLDEQPAVAALLSNGPNILVVDDDPSTARLFREELEKEGYSVTLVSQGSQVIEAVRRQQPDLITLDLVMDVDGLVILQQLKSDPSVADIPVVIISVVHDVEHGLAMGAADYLVKPLDRGELLQAVESVLGRANGSSHHSILVVDDDVDITGWLEIALGEHGYRVTTARDGMQALEMASADPPDLILLDLVMPRMDGRTAMRHLRAQPSTQQIPIIVLTAARFDSRSERANVLKMGARKLLQKPVTIDELMCEVKELIGN
jgi:PAS domain S-box-containing protein